MCALWIFFEFNVYFCHSKYSKIKLVTLIYKINLINLILLNLFENEFLHPSLNFKIIFFCILYQWSLVGQMLSNSFLWTFGLANWFFVCFKQHVVHRVHSFMWSNDITIRNLERIRCTHHYWFLGFFFWSVTSLRFKYWSDCDRNWFKLGAKVIKTFYCFLNFFNLQQYTQTYHKYCNTRFNIYLAGCLSLLIKI